MNKIVVGMFSDTDNAQDAIQTLERMGLDPKDMSLIMKDQGKAKVIQRNTGAMIAGGTATGAVTGAMLGGIVGFLVATGALVGLGGLFIAGPLAAALGLTGAAATTVSGAATGALAGGLVGALMGFGLTGEEARIYERHIAEGGILVAVPVLTDIVDTVKDIYEECNAKEIKVIENRPLHMHAQAHAL